MSRLKDYSDDDIEAMIKAAEAEKAERLKKIPYSQCNACGYILSVWEHNNLNTCPACGSRGAQLIRWNK